MYRIKNYLGKQFSRNMTFKEHKRNRQRSALLSLSRAGTQSGRDVCILIFLRLTAQCMVQRRHSVGLNQLSDDNIHYACYRPLPQPLDIFELFRISWWC